ncbi:MAG: NUDIX hydrolase [Candidatus Heimdallarchaeaceae archaeon]
MQYRIPKSILVYPVRLDGDIWKVLLLKRTQDRGGFWQGVTGHLEGKERPIDAAKRELLEETSFIPKFMFSVDYSYAIPVSENEKDIFPPGTTNIQEDVFVARIDQPDDPTIDPNEHEAWKWFSFEEAEKMLIWEENKIALRIAQKFL